MSVELCKIMVDKVITTKTGATVLDAVKLMNKYEIGCLVVVENGKPVGIITERDLLKRVLAKSEELRNMKVTEIMSGPLVSVPPNIEIEEARNREASWFGDTNRHSTYAAATYQNV